MIDVTVLLLGRNYASTAIGPIEVFHSAGQLFSQLQGMTGNPCFRVTSAAVHGTHVDTGYAVGLVAERTIHQVERTDLIVVPAAGLDIDGALAANQELFPWLRRHEDQGAWIAGMCTGAAFLAAAGLLDGREATSHWGVAGILMHRFPQVKWKMDKLITEDRRVLCSGGVYASIDLSMYLVEKFCGHEIAVQTAKSLLVDMPRLRQTAYAVLPLSKPHDDEVIRRAEARIECEFARELSVEELARGFHMSLRNFMRRFKSATGRTPGQYLQATRIAVAKAMLESGASSVQVVGHDVGYEDSAFFRALFRRETGMSPAEYRSRFRGSQPSASGPENRTHGAQ
jgi:transcriptional regulator GlxA family with amidase domain